MTLDDKVVAAANAYHGNGLVACLALHIHVVLRKEASSTLLRKALKPVGVHLLRDVEPLAKLHSGAGKQGEQAEQGKIMQHKARQGKARQGKARQGKAMQGKAMQGNARQGRHLETELGGPLRLQGEGWLHLE